MSFLKRESCVICNDNNLSNFLVIENFPAYMGTSEQKSGLDVYLDQTWAVCKGCNSIQLKNMVDQDILYGESHCAPVGETWKAHHKEFAEFVINNAPGEIIVEIGAGSGYLSEVILDLSPEVEYVAIEPSGAFINKKVKLVQDFVENCIDLFYGKISVVHSHVIEHLYDPQSTIQSISKNMEPGSKMFFSFPNLKKALDSAGANGLNFEHTLFIDEESVRFILAKSNFKILDVQYFKNHSIFVYAEKDKELQREEPIVFEDQKGSLLRSWSNMSDMANRFYEKSKKVGGRSYIFGAHVFGQAIHYLMKDSSKVSGVLDESEDKIGKRLYGTELMVYGLNEIANQKTPVIALAASYYQKEIKEKILSINKSAIIIEPK